MSLLTKTQSAVEPAARPGAAECRACGETLRDIVVDLGMSPLANAIVAEGDIAHGETCFPLRAYVCRACLLVQLEEFATPERIFSHYSYYSSFSSSWLAHAEKYVGEVARRFALDGDSLVIEIGSNDGYLLQYFAERGVPVLGIEPAANVAEAASRRGIRTKVKFFGTKTAAELASEGTRADLLIANNVLAHVPQLRDFVAGMRMALAPKGVITVEFPHLLRLIEKNQFDTVYHEHFCYFSFCTVERVFAARNLTIFDVDHLQTHGGSLRIYARHEDNVSLPVSGRVEELRKLESRAALNSLATYAGFEERVRETKRKLLEFLIAAKRAGKSIAAYGAAAKGSTLFNYCGVGTDFVDYVADRSIYKQGHLLPGTRVPICGPERIAETRPDYILIVAWNLRDEIVEQLSYVRNWGGRFVVAIPELEVF